jgi:hypothetical protein
MNIGQTLETHDPFIPRPLELAVNGECRRPGIDKNRHPTLVDIMDSPRKSLHQHNKISPK